MLHRLVGAREGELQLLERLAAFWRLSYQILDDLNVMFQQSSQAGKTTARDVPLNRPNMVLSFGPSESLRRLERLLALGDQVLARLMARIPSLDFLEELRARFHLEISAIKAGNFSPAL